jgi:hypothetical protein
MIMKTEADEATTSRHRKSRRRWIRPAISLALIGAALATEVKKPKADRTWDGKLAGFIPYDLRRPTVERARERWWNLSDHRVFVPKVFGVGWTVNFRTLASKFSHTSHTG